MLLVSFWYGIPDESKRGGSMCCRIRHSKLTLRVRRGTTLSRTKCWQQKKLWQRWEAINTKVTSFLSSCHMCSWIITRKQTSTFPTLGTWSKINLSKKWAVSTYYFSIFCYICKLLIWSKNPWQMSSGKDLALMKRALLCKLGKLCLLLAAKKGFNLNNISLLRKELIVTFPFALKASAFFSHIVATAASVYGCKHWSL